MAVAAASVLALPRPATAGPRVTTSPNPPAHATVVLRDIAFHRSTVTISREGSVTWAWRDGTTSGADAVAHNVTSVGRRRFRSASTRDHGRTTRRFPKAGVYRYECTIHAGMTGRVVVR